MLADPLDKLSGKYLNQFYQLAYSRQYEKAVLSLMEILHAIETGGLAIKANAAQADISRTCTEIAAAVTAMLLDPNFALNRQGFSALMVLKGHLRSLFAASGFMDMRHLASKIGKQQGDSVDLMGESDIQKYLLTCTLDIAPNSIVDLVSQLSDERRLLYWLSSLDNKYVVDKRESELRGRLLAVGEGLTDCSANSIGEVQSIIRAWMFCSYWDYPEKHQVKKVLNSVLSNTLKKAGVSVPPLPARRKIEQKPKLLIILELWRFNSAMYRCYAKAISNLKPWFNITAMAQNATIDDEAGAIFDEVIEFSIETPIKKLVGSIIKQSPDIIFYPSVGMQQTIVQFAQLRLAPIQVMSAGHPASSFSPVMDYIVFEEEFLNDPACFSEKIILLKRGAISLTRPSSPVPQALIAESPGVIQLAVNSMYFKITAEFLEVCESIARASIRPVHFHFVIGLNVFNRVSIERTIREIVSECTCYQHLDYQEYMGVVNHCDVQLVPFPFGNTNSFVDATLVGVPSVCLDGPEIHSHTDAVFGRRIGLPETCIATNQEEYIAAAVKLIEDDEYRYQLSRKILATDLDAELFGLDAEQQGQRDLADTFRFLLEQHEALQSSAQQVWRVAERESVTAMNESMDKKPD